MTPAGARRLRAGPAGLRYAFLWRGFPAEADASCGFLTVKHRSLKHDYAEFVERAIEDYKDSIPRAALLGIGDAAVASLAARAQTVLTELVLLEEVDRLIHERLRLPSYAAWCRRRQRRFARWRDAARSGLHADGASARAIRSAAGAHTLLVGDTMADAALFAAAHGCHVSMLTATPEPLERTMVALDAVGAGSRVRGGACSPADWTPYVTFQAVLCGPDAFDQLSWDDERHAVRELQLATAVGGVHVLTAGPGPDLAGAVRRWGEWYAGWNTRVETDAALGELALVARREPER